MHEQKNIDTDSLGMIMHMGNKLNKFLQNYLRQVGFLSTTYDIDSLQ